MTLNGRYALSCRKDVSFRTYHKHLNEDRPIQSAAKTQANDSSYWRLDPPAAEYPPNSPKKHRWPKIRRKKMRLAENPLNRKFAAAAEKNCGYCGAFNTTGC